MSDSGRRGRRRDIGGDLGGALCRWCRKKTWRSKKAAKLAARRAHPGVHLDEYPCPEIAGGWHYGHLKTVTKVGDMRRYS